MFSWSELEVPADFGPTVVCIGKFDALHLGHQAIAHDLVEASEEKSLPSVAVTFDQHPNVVLKPNLVPLPILGPIQKRHLFESFGLSALLTLEFNQELANLPAREFIKRYLVDLLHAKEIVVGQAFKFGRGGLGNLQLLEELAPELGFRARGIGHREFDGEKIATTRIRELILEGDVTLAGQMLGRNHFSTGRVVEGRKLGRTLGFPTANLERTAEGLLPADGIYAGYLNVASERYPAAISVGINDTFEAIPRLVEAHAIGRQDLELYGELASIEYVAKVRGWTKFDSVEELIAQMHKDCAEAEVLLSQHLAN